MLQPGKLLDIEFLVHVIIISDNLFISLKEKDLGFGPLLQSNVEHLQGSESIAGRGYSFHI